MKILLYLDPWVEISDKPDFKLVFFNDFIDNNLTKFCAYSSFVEDEDVEVKVLCSEFAKLNITNKKYEFLDFVTFSQSEVKNIFSDFKEYLSAQTLSECNQKLSIFNDVIKQKLGDYTPDLIIPISSTAKGLKFLYPNALILFNENGLFARYPYPRCLYFDCASEMGESFLLKYQKEIMSFPITKKEEEFVDKIRNHFLSSLNPYNIFSQKILELRNKFKVLVLLPLQVFNSPMFITQGGNLFKDQFDYLEHVLSSVDKDVGVIVTEHIHDKIIIFDPVLKYLSAKYDNFIYFGENNDYINPSQFLISLVDAVVTISSTVGLQTLLHKKPLFVPSKTSYLNAFCDGNDLSQIKNFIQSGNYKNKDGAFYYLITRYYIPSYYYDQDKWLYDFIKRSLQRFKKGVDFTFYDKIDSDENLLKVICDDSNFSEFENIMMHCKSSPPAKKKPRGIRRLIASIKKRISLVKKSVNKFIYDY